MIHFSIVVCHCVAISLLALTNTVPAREISHEICGNFIYLFVFLQCICAQTIPFAENYKVQKVNVFVIFKIYFQNQKVVCPISSKPLKLKDLMPVKFTEAKADEEVGHHAIKSKVSVCVLDAPG